MVYLKQGARYNKVINIKLIAMRKEYSALILALVVLPIAALAQYPVNVEVRPTNVRATNQIRLNDSIKTDLEAQREKLRAEAEARRKAALEKGDESSARMEELRLNIQKKRAEADARREKMRLEAEARRAQIKARSSDIREDVAKNKAEVTAKVMAVMIERLENLIVRIESRIEKIKARGGDVSEGERLVLAAKTNISDAKAGLAEFASVDLSGDSIKENFERIRAVAAEIREHLRAARENLIMAVRALSSAEFQSEAEAESQSTN